MLAEGQWCENRSTIAGRNGGIEHIKYEDRGAVRVEAPEAGPAAPQTVRVKPDWRKTAGREVPQRRRNSGPHHSARFPSCDAQSTCGIPRRD